MKAGVCRSRTRASAGPFSRSICFLILLTGAVSSIVYHEVALGHGGDVEAALGLAAIVAALVIPGLALRGHYDPRAVSPATIDLKPLLMTWAGTFLFLAGVAFSLNLAPNSRAAPF